MIMRNRSGGRGQMRDHGWLQENTIVSGVAGRYASSLFELAKESNAVDAVGRDLEAFDRLVQTQPDVDEFRAQPGLHG